MTLTADVAVLSGERLTAFLDDLDGLLEGDIGDPISQRMAQFKQALAGVRLKPDSVPALMRCVHFLLHAEDTHGALRLLDDEETLARIDVPPADRRMHRFDRLFARAAAHCIADDTAAQLQALSDADGVLTEDAPDQPPQHAWFQLAERYGKAGDRTSERRVLAAGHAQFTALPERATMRAWDAAVLATHLAGSLKHEGRIDEAHAAVDDAIAALGQTRGAILENQAVDIDDWLRLGDLWVDLSPASVERVAQYARGLMPTDTAPAQRRAVEIRIARLEARALVLQGRLDEAVQRSAAGRFALTANEADEFSVLVLGWLEAAGRREEAARLAWESERSLRDASSEAACAMAATRAIADPGAHALWHLTLAHAAHRGMADAVRSSESQAAFLERHLALARASRDASDPHVAASLDAFEAQRLADRGHYTARVLALLERATADPALADRDVLERLWLCRVKLHGPQAALAMPYVETHSAGWAYNIGVILSSHLQESAGISDADWPEAAADALAERYYERGFNLFRACFETGQGRYRDADAHVYSMLCNNLAILLRRRGEPEAAALLHEMGLEASPFAEHHRGLMRCYDKAGDDLQFVEVADRLWHFAADHGYCRHDAADYVGDVACALHRLARDGEIAMWLQRLEDWWSALDAEDRGEERDNYLSALVITLAQQAHAQPEDAVLRIESSLDAIRAVPRAGTLRLAGRVFLEAGHVERARALFEEELQKYAQGAFTDPDHLRYVKADLARCEAATSAHSRRPWWKVWA